MPRTLPALASLLLLTLCPATIHAQGPGLGSENRVGAAVSLRAGATWVDGGPTPIGSLSATLRLSRQFEVGGEAAMTLRPTLLDSEESSDAPELSLGYGGLLLRWTSEEGTPSPSFRWRAGLLLGAGSARLESVVLDHEVASENFLFAEPEIALLLSQDRNIRLSIEGRYRLASATARLSELGPQGVRGASLTLGVQFVHDP